MAVPSRGQQCCGASTRNMLSRVSTEIWIFSWSASMYTSTKPLVVRNQRMSKTPRFTCNCAARCSNSSASQNFHCCRPWKNSNSFPPESAQFNSTRPCIDRMCTFDRLHSWAVENRSPGPSLPLRSTTIPSRTGLQHPAASAATRM